MMDIRSQLTKKKTLFGMIITINAPSICEALSTSGFDWLWIDMEHSPFSLSDVQTLVQANRCLSLVRIPIHSQEWITRVFDLGVEGIIIPHVNSAEEIRKIIPITYYPPKGTRSLSMARASKFGLDRDYRENANAKRTLFAQIEDREGVENIDEIVSVIGLDGIIIGPYDLSASYGMTGEVEAPEIVTAINKILTVGKKKQKPVGIFAKNSQIAKNYINQGFDLVAIGADIHYLLSGAKAAIDECIESVHKI